jgi:CHAD domain-containing protein
MAKAWEVPGLGPGVPLSRCARLIVDTRFREMMSYRAGTIAGEDIEQLHSMRVSTRRLRSAMRNFRNCFDRVGLRYHDRRVKEIADALGTVRDLDVRIAWLATALAAARHAERSGVRLLLDRAKAAREHARGPMVERLEGLERDGYEREFLAFVWDGVEEGARG